MADSDPVQVGDIFIIEQGTIRIDKIEEAIDDTGPTYHVTWLIEHTDTPAKRGQSNGYS